MCRRASVLSLYVVLLSSICWIHASAQGIWDQPAIPWSEALYHIGEAAVVEGPVASTGYGSDGTFYANIGNPYPNVNRVSIAISPECVERLTVSVRTELAEWFAGHAIQVFGVLELGPDRTPYIWDLCDPANVRLLEELPGTSIPDEEIEEEVTVRFDWLLAQRAYPLIEVPPGVRYQAREYLNESLLQAAGDALQEQAETAQILNLKDRLMLGELSVPQLLQLVAPLPAWQEIGPAPIADRTGYPQAGRINAIALHPICPDVIYVGAADGGVWRTYDGGHFWQPLTDFEDSLAVGSIAVATSDPKRVYAGTGDLVGFPGAGLLSSDDGGNTWTHILGPFYTSASEERINRVAVASTDPEWIYVASSIGVYVSHSGGLDLNATTQPVLSGLATDVVVSPADPNIAYAAITKEQPATGGGVFRTDDGGQTWERTGSGVLSCSAPNTPGCCVSRTHLAMSYTNPNVLYALVRNPADGKGIGVYRYDDAEPSPTWERRGEIPNLDRDFCRGQCWYNMAIAVQPNDPDGVGPLEADQIVYIGGTRSVLRSTDGGATWVELRESVPHPDREIIHADIHALIVDAEQGTLYAGTDGGIAKLENAALAEPGVAKWISVNGTDSCLDCSLPLQLAAGRALGITQFYPGISATSPRPDGGFTIMGGAQDNGVLYNTPFTYYTSGARSSIDALWDQHAGGDGGYTAVGHNAQWFTIGVGPSSIWLMATAHTGNVRGNLVDFSVFSTNPKPAAVTPLVLNRDSAIDATVVGLNQEIWITYLKAVQTDPQCGERWCLISPELPQGITTAAIAPDMTATVGSTIIAVRGPLFVGGRGRIYRAFGDPDPTCTLGQSDCWQEITGALPNRYVTDLAIDARDYNFAGSYALRVYATLSGYCAGNPCAYGQGHVFSSANPLDANPVWDDISSNLPDTPANAVVVDPDIPEKLYVATDLGVFYTDNAGGSWSILGSGLPNSHVFDLILVPGTRLLVAATYGRGMFMFDLEEAFEGAGP